MHAVCPSCVYYFRRFHSDRLNRTNLDWIWLDFYPFSPEKVSMTFKKYVSNTFVLNLRETSLFRTHQACESVPQKFRFLLERNALKKKPRMKKKTCSVIICKLQPKNDITKANWIQFVRIWWISWIIIELKDWYRWESFSAHKLNIKGQRKQKEEVAWPSFFEYSSSSRSDESFGKNLLPLPIDPIKKHLKTKSLICLG